MILTVLDETISELEVLSSKFIASIRHVESEEEFATHVKEVKERFPKAKHYCYGARFGVIEKMGDDGEPSHSAGLQILSSLRNKKLDEVSIVVVRYFGGVKLGLPRLTRTYRDISEKAILEADIREIKEGKEVLISIPYNEIDKTKYRLDKLSLSIKKIIYLDEVSITFFGEKEVVDEFLKEINQNIKVSSKDIKIFKEVSK